MSLLDFQPIPLATKFHETPRFGASNDISDLAGDEDMMLGYIRGVLGISALMILSVLSWLLVLMYLKCYCGRKIPSCASGGGVIYIKQLREVHHLTKSQRKNIIRRQWRVQGLALFACALVIPANFVGIQLGLHPFLDALHDVQAVNDQIESKAYQGKDIGNRLEGYYKNLTLIPLDGFTIAELCPKQLLARKLFLPSQKSNTSVNDSNVTSLLEDLLLWKELVAQGRKDIDERFRSINMPTEALYLITNATHLIDYGIDYVVENDWYLKLGLLVLDVVALFWCLGILVTQSNFIWRGMHRVAAYFLIPAMFLLLPVLVAAVCGFGVMLLANADFCVGNDTYTSPLGSLSNLIQQINGAAFEEMLHYYSMNCLATNPLQFLDSMEWEISDALSALEQIDSVLNENSGVWIDACNVPNATISNVDATISATRTALTGIRGSVSAAVQLTECSSIIPILRRLVYGATCEESIQSLTAMFGCSVALVIIVMLLLTTRSALFSPIIRGRRNKRRETEFMEYKHYMSKFYQTKDWSVDWVPPENSEFVPEIKRTDTQSTASPTSSSDSDTVVAQAYTNTPHKAGMFVNSGSLYESHRDDDSYDSTYSSDEEGDAADSTSMLSSLSRFVEKYNLRHRSGGLNESYSTTNSVLSDARRRISSVVNGQRALSILAGVRDRYSFRHTSYYENSEDDDAAIEDRDSVMLTPEPDRYTTRVRFHSSNKKRREDPDDFEMIALSPKQPVFSPTTNRAKETQSLARRFGGYY